MSLRVQKILTRCLTITSVNFQIYVQTSEFSERTQNHLTKFRRFTTQMRSNIFFILSIVALTCAALHDGPYGTIHEGHDTIEGQYCSESLTFFDRTRNYSHVVD
jgi:hypothetical protein